MKKHTPRTPDVLRKSGAHQDRTRVTGRERVDGLELDQHDECCTCADCGPTCYQCLAPVAYLFADGRGACCTRLTPEEVQ